jgi:hypothetical protein
MQKMTAADEKKQIAAAIRADKLAGKTNFGSLYKNNP